MISLFIEFFPKWEKVALFFFFFLFPLFYFISLFHIFISDSDLYSIYTFFFFFFPLYS